MAKIKIVDLFLGISFLILVLLTVFAASNPDFGKHFELSKWFGTESVSEISFWSALGFTALVCFLGALVPVPIPYAIPVSVFSAAWIVTYPNPWIPILVLVMVATLANTIGDFLDYVIGQGTEYILSKEDPDLQNRWAQIILKKPKAIPGVIFIFGLTPLPDSVLLVPLGIVNYSMKKTIFWMYVGKFFMMLTFSLAGIFGLNWLLDKLQGAEESGNGWVMGMALLYFIWLMILIMVKVKPKEKEPEKKTLNTNDNKENTQEDVKNVDETNPTGT